MAVNKNKNYSIEQLEALIYNAANTFHGGGNLQNTELLYIAIPTILIKRLLDTREDMIEEYLKDITEENTCSYLEALDKGLQEFPAIFHTKEKPWFFITYQDVIHYGDNPLAKETEIKCGPDKSVIIKTNARDKIELWEEVCNSFKETIIHSIFSDSRYFSLYMKDKLGTREAKNLLNKFAEEHFGENITTDMFAHVYIFIISKFAESAGKKGGEFFTPDILCDLVVKCLEPELNPEGDTNICDITSGSGTFLISMANYLKDKYKVPYENAGISVVKALNKHLHIFMQEKEQMTLMLGEVGLLMAGFNKITSHNDNTLLAYYNNIGQQAGKIDYFVGNPPYGAKILQEDDYQAIKSVKGSDPRWEKWGVPAKRMLEWFFVQTDIELLNEKGRGGLILPTGVLYQNNSRNKMLNMDIIEGVILLPKDMFQTTKIQTCAVFFNKNKKEGDKGKVFMIDASKNAKRVGKFNTINLEELVDIYTNRKEVEGVSTYADVEHIKRKKGSIEPFRYLTDEENDEDDEDEDNIDIKSVENELNNIITELYLSLDHKHEGV